MRSARASWEQWSVHQFHCAQLSNFKSDLRGQTQRTRCCEAHPKTRYYFARNFSYAQEV